MYRITSVCIQIKRAWDFEDLAAGAYNLRSSPAPVSATTAPAYYAGITKPVTHT
jgi:hypothetical protein